MLTGRLDYDADLIDRSGKIGEHEPVFLLRAQDKNAPMLVRRWALHAEIDGVDPATMVAAARGHALAMDEWQLAHGSKVPDMPAGEKADG